MVTYSDCLGLYLNIQVPCNSKYVTFVLRESSASLDIFYLKLKFG